MTQKKQVQVVLVSAFALLSAGGWLMHLRLHPPADAASNWFPAMAGFVSTLVLPVLFLFRPTVSWAYLTNGMLVILGTLMMADYSLSLLSGWPGWSGLFWETTLPEILVLGSKFALGKALFELMLLKGDQAPHRQGRFWRYPNMGFWWVHGLVWTAVFYLGRILWP